MKPQFEILFLEDAFNFLKQLDRKHYEKVLYNIRRAQNETNSDLFKKLSNDIWEFRTLYQGLQYRLLAFWDKTSSTETLVISTHGFIKKRSKVPENEIEKAIRLRTKYFEDKKMYQNKSTTLFTSIMGNHQHLTHKTKRLKENCDHSVWCFS